MRLSVLGHLELRLDGEPVELAPMQRRLAAVLAARPNRPVTRRVLVAELWGEAPPAAVDKALSWHIARLRKLVDDPGRVAWHGGGYLLRLEPSEVDFKVFERRHRDGVDAAESRRSEAASKLFAEALALWRGPAYDGLAETGLLRREAERLEQLRLATVERRCEAELRLGRHAELVDELGGLVAAQPFRERLREQLMLALYRSGRQAEALAVYRDGKARLSRELGMDPGPELTRLERRILSNDPNLAPPEAATVVAANRPEPIRQLPRPSGGIVGRAEARAAIDAIARAEPAAIVAVTGMAGVGKTSLAVSWARERVERFPDGQLFAGLRGFDTGPPAEPREVLARFLRALGVGAADIPEDLDGLTELYRSRLADRRVLVLLDDAADAAQVRPLLPGGPHCLVVVTSRNSLSGLVALDGARRVPVAVLSAAEARQLLCDTVGRQRVEAESAAAEELARRCGRLPLALRIAAANLIDHPHRSIADQVAALSPGDGLAGLAVGGDPAAAVAPAFDVSYRRLSRAAQGAFRLLGWLPSVSFGPAAAAAATGTDVAAAADALAELAAAHLLEPAEPQHYRFHDLVRVHARRWCEAEDAEPVREAAVAGWIDWYLRCATGAADVFGNDPLRLPSPEPLSTVPTPEFADADAAVAWLSVEQSNLLAASRTAAQRGSSATWLLADALRGYFASRSEFRDWAEMSRAGYRVAEAADDARARAAMDRSLGWRARELGDHDAACRHYRAMREYARSVGDTDGEGAALVGIASSLFTLGRLSPAAEYCVQAMRISRHTEERPPLLVTNILGITTRELGRLKESAAILRVGVAETREAGDGDLHVLLTSLAATQLALGDLPRAKAGLDEALRLSRGLGAVRTATVQLENLARVHIERGELAEARSCAERALGTARELGLTTYELFILNTLAATESEPDAITAPASRALELALELDITVGVVEARLNLSRSRRLSGEPEASIDQAERAHELARDTEHRILAGRALTALARAHLAADDREAARSFAEAAVETHRANGSRILGARAVAVLAEATTDAAAARTLRRRAASELADCGAVPRHD